MIHRFWLNIESRAYRIKPDRTATIQAGDDVDQTLRFFSNTK